MNSLLKLSILVLFFSFISINIYPQESEFIESDACTSILVGKKASKDGSTMTSHSCDSGSDRTWINKVERKRHKRKEMSSVYNRAKRTYGPDDPNTENKLGEIPQVKETFAYINTAYPVMNEYQLATGETTFGGKRALKSDSGLINAPELYRLILERAKNAREAIEIADKLTKKYGYIDAGECLTFADPNEVWIFEIMGPGAGNIGAVWAAVRIPEDQIAVSANASRIRKLDLEDSDNYLASDNVFSLAQELGWWNPETDGDFEFCYAYASRTSMGCRLREWRVLSLLAPSLNLNPYSENYPLSVKPEKQVTVKDILSIFRDNYQGTQFELAKSLTSVDKEGKVIQSPVASPFLNGELRTLFNLKRERPICVPYSTYLTVTQSRSWLPNEIGGIVWLGYDNPATTPHLPFYIGISEMPDSYMVDGRYEYSTDCAWWSYRRVSKLAMFRYQEMKVDIQNVWEEIETNLFEKQESFEKEALYQYNENPETLVPFLTDYSSKNANKAVKAYWNLGDELWLKYAAKF